MSHSVVSSWTVRTCWQPYQSNVNGFFRHTTPTTTRTECLRGPLTLIRPPPRPFPRRDSRSLNHECRSVPPFHLCRHSRAALLAKSPSRFLSEFGTVFVDRRRVFPIWFPAGFKSWFICGIFRLRFAVFVWYFHATRDVGLNCRVYDRPSCLDTFSNTSQPLVHRIICHPAHPKLVAFVFTLDYSTHKTENRLFMNGKWNCLPNPTILYEKLAYINSVSTVLQNVSNDFDKSWRPLF